MRKTRFSEEQIINILKGVEAGQRVADACRAHGISEISLEEARSVSEEWRIDYNERRPHRSLQHLTPAEFAAKCSSKQPMELSL